MIWSDFNKYLIDNDEVAMLLKKAGNIEDTETPENYKNIWKDISFMVQLKKARTHGLTEEQTRNCLSALIKRPYYLTYIANQFNAKNILEVGTAEGLQFYSFAEYAENVNGHVWSCDLVVKRNRRYAEVYDSVTTFCLGDSRKLSSSVSEKIDLFYIDASHESGAVLRDVANLKSLQSDNPIWIFDDFDTRFGCFEDIKKICMKSGKFKIYRVGNAASGNPNHQVVVFGKL